MEIYNIEEFRSKMDEIWQKYGKKCDIDEEKTKTRGEEIEISTPESSIRVFVIPTNEELVIARDTLEIVENLK